MENVKYFTVDKDGTERMFYSLPARMADRWILFEEVGPNYFIQACDVVRKGTIKELTGRKMTWKDEPVKIKIG